MLADLGVKRCANALAVHAAPELQHVFADWLKELEAEALAKIRGSENDAAALTISEENARYLLTRLAPRDSITLTGNRSPGRMP